VRWTDYYGLGCPWPARRQEQLTQIVSLEAGWEEVRSRMEKAKRKQARRGEREGLRLARARSSQEVAAYYRIYMERIRRWGERDYYPERLFQALVAEGGEEVRLTLLYRGEELLGGHLNFYFGDTVIAWNGVTKVEAAAYKAATFLYFRLLEDACRQGYRFYNLGGSLGKESLRQFKASLGGVDHRYFCFEEETTLFHAAHRVRSLLGRRR